MSSLAGSFSYLRSVLRKSAVAAPADEEVLSLDLEENDFLYRIRRNARILYVSILDGDILPPDCRTDGDRVISNLRNLPDWEKEWKTLTVRKNGQSVQCTPDEFSPHGVNLRQLSAPPVFYNLLDLTTVDRISDRVSRVRYDGAPWILKVARFRHEIPALQREISVYSTLTSSGFPLAPRLIGLVYEEEKTRTVGFLMEEIVGETPGIQDLGDCIKTVRLLHTFGILHGDLNKFNFLMTEHGAKVFDFEVSDVQKDLDAAAAEEEIGALAAKLEDESDIGKR